VVKDLQSAGLPFSLPRVRTPPSHLDVGHLGKLLREAWGFEAVGLRYAPVGFGSHHWVASDATGERRFVTVDELDEDQVGGLGAAFERLRRALLTARVLKDAAELSWVVAPLVSMDGAVLHRLGGSYAAALYPFVDGRRHADGQKLEPEQRAALVGMLTRLHDATPTVQALAGVDALDLQNRGSLEKALRELAVPWAGGPFAEQTRGVLNSNAAQLRTLLSHYDRLVSAVRASDVAWVITHGEPKPNNLLDTEAGLMFVDWDTTLIAPPARDLWMVDARDGQAVDQYTELTGRRVGKDHLRLYRLRWHLSDLAGTVRWFSAPHNRTADTELAWHGLAPTLTEAAEALN
jgi:spectinomycin phosphotransferase